jgi:hypothetical protein
MCTIFFQVEESMNNLETVVRERNEAYFKLETGQTGERPVCVRKGTVGKTFTEKFMYKVV